MNRHTIVLAEEKVSIMRLIGKAVEKKPVGQERIGKVVMATDEAALFDALAEGVEPIVLLSTTFSPVNSHEAVIAAIHARFPSVRIITLTHKYGDRSSLDFGAYESVDKPIRNPVLWEILDRAILASDTKTPATEPPKKQAFTLTKPATEPEKAPEVKPVPAPVAVAPIVSEPEPEPEPASPKSAVLFDSNDDDEDEDDLFGAPVVATRTAVVNQPVSLFVEEPEEEPEETFEFQEAEPVPVEEEEEPVEEPETEEELEFSFVLETEPDEMNAPEVPELPSDGLKPESVIVDVPHVVEFDIPQHTEPEEIPAEPWQVETEEEPEEAFLFDLIEEDEPEAEKELEEALIEPEDEVEPPVIEVNDVHEATPLEVEEEEEPVEPTQEPLEQNREINPESPTYNELSEWTLANEGFTTKNGEFVSLVPPRVPKGKSAQQAIRVQRTTTAKPTVGSDGADTDGFFGSVRNIFKKK